MSSSGRNHNAKNNTSSSANQNENREEGFGMGVMLLAAAGSAIIGGLIGYSLTSAPGEEAEIAQTEPSVPAQPPTECLICLEPLGTRPLEQLPCSHLLHLKCLAEWLRASDGSVEAKNCPICRAPLTSRQLAIYQKRCGL